MDRYVGNPFLRFVDCYVLKAIGHLEERHKDGLRQMTPALVKTYGVRGSWDAIVAQVMRFPPTLPAKIKEIWDKNAAHAKSLNQAIDPEEFTTRFVDQNFLPKSV
ncbi:hypothetical protein CCAX7_53700 [Capsulimonas corticalis]|uniref:Uncharacterized protein n=1 Tax=Capsulimonas corticalis TaxID=2219043 RepID=A0A402CNP9_9BACT|nr:hypothetical protein [Capsulimonas corticalis]BDI33319.1 hypothetical protein CCAX7_53700 [Capsulimonas corticalis]